VDVVEVLRGTAAGPLLVAAGALGAVAAVATVLVVAAWWTGRRGPAPTSSALTRGRRPTAWLLTVGAATSTLELGLLLLDGAPLTGRWPVVVLVRLLLLAGLAVLPASLAPGPAPSAGADARDPSGHDGDPPGFRAASDGTVRLVAGALSVGLLITAVLGAPTATGALPAGAMGLATAAAAVTVLGAVAAVVFRVTAPLGRTAVLAAPLALLVLVAAPVGVAITPDRVPPHQQAQLEAHGLTLDLTVAPVRPGTNEFHLYAFGVDGRPAPVRDVTVEVVGHPEGRHELFPVSDDHHLSYVLDLPEAPRWALEVGLVGPDGAHRALRWPIEPPG
jgi:hypothetical protein